MNKNKKKKYIKIKIKKRKKYDILLNKIKKVLNK